MKLTEHALKQTEISQNSRNIYFAFFINFHSRSQKRGETKNQERFKIADILLTFDLHFFLNPEEYCLLGIY